MAQVPVPLFQIGDLVIFLSQLEVGVFVVTGGPFGPNNDGVFSYIIESVDSGSDDLHQGIASYMPRLLTQCAANKRCLA